MDTEHFAPSPTKDGLENKGLNANKNVTYNNVSKTIYRIKFHIYHPEVFEV